jgi:hypothetical protein
VAQQVQEDAGRASAGDHQYALPEGDTAKIIAARKKLKADQLEAAKAAAPFCHYRIAAVTIEPEQAARLQHSM